MERDNGKGNFVDYILSKSVSSKKEETKELDTELNGGDCDVEEEISYLKNGKHGGQGHTLLRWRTFKSR